VFKALEGRRMEDHSQVHEISRA